MSRYYVLDKQIQLGKLLGEGGEGKVYLSSSLPSKAIKIYSDTSDAARINKIQKMVSLGLAKKSNLISFPDEVVTSEAGKVIGFSMNFVSNHQQVHNLYGVKSRKQTFPDADYRFLVRVATNIARAIAEVHTYPCIIGDINHSGVLVAKNATVALIDADSFQLNENGKIYPCVVGVPDFTPPELQGRSLRNIERTQIHDQFGLAVLIFQILVMGRHPFAGRGRDLSLEECIAQFLFAYSKNQRQGVIAPPGTPTLDDFPNSIASAFEHSFGKNSLYERTSATNWVSLLEELENSLIKCKINAKHYYPQNANSCPWCRMETTTGAILFHGGVTLIHSNLNMSDIERILNDILSFKIEVLDLYPTLPELLNPTTSVEIVSSNNKSRLKKKISKFCWSGVVASGLFLFVKPSIWIILMAGIFFWIAKVLENNEENNLIKNYKKLSDQWNYSLNLWREKTIGGIFNTRFNLEKTIWELKQLNGEKEGKLQKLKSGHREKQLQAHLDKFLIKNTKIKSISPALVASLASHGIESAADIDYHKIRSISQFGEVRTTNLVTWKKQIEQSFRYNPSLQVEDISAQNQIINEFELKMRDKKSYIIGQKEIFDRARSDFYTQSKLSDEELNKLHLEIEQLRFDLKFLNIPIPQTSQFVSNIKIPIFKPHGQSYSHQPNQQSSGVQPQNQGIPTCPKCTSSMVRRWSKRGPFWGCSRYPKCNGTRNI